MTIIKDWAGNILDHSGFMKNPQLAVPMTFESWDDAETWLSENLSDYEHDRGEY